MEVPKHIEAALRRRGRAAFNFWSADNILSEYINKNELPVDPECYGGGMKALMQPRESAEKIRLAILEKENNKKDNRN